MSLSSVTVCLNALRLNLLKIRDSAHDKPRRSARKKNVSSVEKHNAVTLDVDGMMCPHCEATVKAALEALDFVISAEADHKSGTVKLELYGTPDIDKIRATIEENGYILKGTDHQNIREGNAK